MSSEAEVVRSVPGRSATTPATPGGWPVAVADRPARHRHRAVLRRAAVVLDAVTVTGVTGGALAVAGATPTTLTLAGATVVAELGGLAIARAWDPCAIGAGGAEFSRLARGTVTATVAVALLALVLTASGAPGTVGQAWALLAVPATGVAAALGRTVLRLAVARARRRGRFTARVLAVGTPAAVADLAARTRRVPAHGWEVVAACTSTGTGREIAGVPVVGDLDAVAAEVHRTGAEVVAVAPSPGWTPRRLHELAWRLEGLDVDLVVDPGLMEIAGPRLHVAPVDGLPLLRLRPPSFRGGPHAVKAVIDRVVAALAVTVLAPVFLLLAVLVRRDGGPVFYRQVRIGRDGRPFAMVKFRSMVVGADRVRPDGEHDGAGPLFKLRADPRVTPIGTVLRRWSLDELPQLFNVLGGSMSLVGPRPPLPEEVGTYAEDARRRLLVRPGLTGLWQVSGRSDLSWEDTVRLDLRYVENWSPALDLLILARTVSAVVSARGAY
ncbi:exopolysaccharide biosynthesis polyprenyl glycosylphosphotransferase [Actinomycetospora succinea]|uniref:Exopolysaccharide biosynthesis polyprenyl glycosylphosphotransferase n=1 Tax=Actinomycetospora succinea TaxID=663603 RepID=A0A4R6V8Z7_9PSEU|nr:sugar transferase [Actinomycetospora succinea]TDQ58307.1 exopolysaccharide biosynthesis polyprenyl glycosylphosphotransferase [Actinomycetospora succinea]